ncbi:hypothetical protein [Kitasatospora purpeofusca]|uniref:hypothetical protein n=1 Tax=Kitasatospora purpeofusca TaxID=67352 RepID=UPI003804DA0A
MTTPLSAPPPRSDPRDTETSDGWNRARPAAEPAAPQRAADAGEAAAAWVRELAGRQGEEEHARLLVRVAEAIVRASRREVVPGSKGLLVEELRYTLAADVVLGASQTTGTLPELRTGERMPLITVCAIAAALPSCVLGDLAAELDLLADGLAAATEAGRTATAAGAARSRPARRPRTLGSDHGDPLNRLAYRRVAARAAETFEIALHYQGGRDEKARAQALHNALAAAGGGIAAAALLRVADDPALGLDLDQWEHLHRIAAERRRPRRSRTAAAGMTPPPAPSRARRALGPGAAQALADTIRAPRTPPPWSPAAVDAALRTVCWNGSKRRGGTPSTTWTRTSSARPPPRPGRSAPIRRRPSTAWWPTSTGSSPTGSRRSTRWGASSPPPRRTGRCPSGPPTPAAPRTSASAGPARHCSRPSPATTTAHRPTEIRPTGRGDHPRPGPGRIGRVTSSQPLPRGLTSLIPDARARATPGERAASQLLHLHEATVPVPVLAAAAELIAPQLKDPDPATREAATAVHARLLAAIDGAAPGR